MYLEQLNLNSNKLGREVCRSIAKLLEKGGSRLKEIFLAATDTSDEEAVVIANSLKFNTSLRNLYLDGNNFEERDSLQYDVSSICSAYNSNHTLITVLLPDSTNATISIEDMENPILQLKLIRVTKGTLTKQAEQKSFRHS